jgi:hypothetical protein
MYELYTDFITTTSTNYRSPQYIKSRLYNFDFIYDDYAILLWMEGDDRKNIYVFF